MTPDDLTAIDAGICPLCDGSLHFLLGDTEFPDMNICLTPGCPFQICKVGVGTPWTRCDEDPANFDQVTANREAWM